MSVQVQSYQAYSQLDRLPRTKTGKLNKPRKSTKTAKNMNSTSVGANIGGNISKDESSLNSGSGWNAVMNRSSSKGTKTMGEFEKIIDLVKNDKLGVQFGSKNKASAIPFQLSRKGEANATNPKTGEKAPRSCLKTFTRKASTKRVTFSSHVTYHQTYSSAQYPRTPIVPATMSTLDYVHFYHMLQEQQCHQLSHQPSFAQQASALPYNQRQDSLNTSDRPREGETQQALETLYSLRTHAYTRRTTPVEKPEDYFLSSYSGVRTNLPSVTQSV